MSREDAFEGQVSFDPVLFYHRHPGKQKSAFFSGISPKRNVRSRRNFCFTQGLTAIRKIIGSRVNLVHKHAQDIQMKNLKTEWKKPHDNWPVSIDYSQTYIKPAFNYLEARMIVE